MQPVPAFLGSQTAGGGTQAQILQVMFCEWVEVQDKGQGPQAKVCSWANIQGHITVSFKISLRKSHTDFCASGHAAAY